jgi:hypothetical protein
MLSTLDDDDDFYGKEERRQASQEWNSLPEQGVKVKRCYAEGCDKQAKEGGALHFALT